MHSLHAVFDIISNAAYTEKLKQTYETLSELHFHFV